MALMKIDKIEKVDVWSGDIRNEPGGLAAALDPLVAAGADFSFLIARRRPEDLGSGIVFLGGLRGAKQTKAALSAGLARADDLAGLRVEARDKPGLVHEILTRISSAGINLHGVSASVVGTRCVIVFAFAGTSDRDKAAQLLKK